MTLLVLTLWLIITGLTAYVFYNLGKKAPKGNTLSTEERRLLEKEKRELENFWKYTGDSQEGYYGK